MGRIVKGPSPPFAAINNMEQKCAQSQAVARDMIDQVEVKVASAGNVRLVGLVAKFTRASTSLRHLPRRLGRQTTEVLGVLGNKYRGTGRVQGARRCLIVDANKLLYLSLKSIGGLAKNSLIFIG